MCLLVICILLWRNNHSDLLFIFHLGFLFYCWLVRALYILEIRVFKYMICKCSRSLSELSFHFLDLLLASHSSTLAWKIPWAEEPGRLQSMGSLTVGHDWATSLSFLTFMHWRRKWQPTRVLAWRIPGTGEPGGLPSLGSHRVGHDWSDLAAAAAAAKLPVKCWIEVMRINIVVLFLVLIGTISVFC